MDKLCNNSSHDYIIIHLQIAKYSQKADDEPLNIIYMSIYDSDICFDIIL